MKKSRLLRCFQLILLISCLFLMSNVAGDADSMKKCLQESFPNHKIGNNYCVLVLADARDGCPACNRAFCDFLEKNAINYPNCFIILYSTGMAYDISDLLSAKNTYNDRKTRKFFAKGTEKSEAIIVKNNKIDTIITIEAQTINKNLPLIAEKIKSFGK